MKGGRTMKKRMVLLGGCLFFILVVLGVFFPNHRAEAKAELNILVMPGYEEPQIINEFEKKYDCKINFKIYPSSDEMMALLLSSKKGTFDVVTPDAPYVAKLVKANLIKPLNPKDYPINDFFPRFHRFEQHWIDNKLYAVTSRWGFYGLAYNSKYVDAADMQSYAGLWKEKYKGKIAIFDWYLPNMGCIAKYLGYQKPYDIGTQELTKVADTLYSLKPYVGTIAPTNSDTIQALANANMWISIAGEWLQVLLKEQGHPIELSNPKEGGVSWTEALVIMKDSKNPELAKKYCQWILSPEIQARLAWANAFHATVPNMKAVNFMKKGDAAMLHMDDGNYLNAVLKNIAPRKLPADEEAWKKIWQTFKSK
jgi:spermidine/putrescine transport system substrate-binding protein